VTRRDVIVVVAITAALTGCGGTPGGPTTSGRVSAANLAVSYGPYLGVRCRTPGRSKCDKVGVDIVLKKGAVHASATIAGRRVPLRTPGLHNGIRGKDWVGNLVPAGLARKGSPLYIHKDKGHWAGDPPVNVPIRITATYANGRRLSTTFPRVPLRSGWG
jgi:hypothetical protein